MHNLCKEICITFNDLAAEKFTNYFLDFWAAFTVPASKQVGYDNMIGNINSLIQPHGSASPLPQTTLNLPIPFFYSRDSGLALPTAALPYNDIRLSFSFRNWTDLLILDDIAAVGAGAINVPTLADIGGTAPQLTQVQVWSNYAIVSTDERKENGLCSKRYSY